MPYIICKLTCMQNEAVSDGRKWPFLPEEEIQRLDSMKKLEAYMQLY